MQPRSATVLAIVVSFAAIATSAVAAWLALDADTVKGSRIEAAEATGPDGAELTALRQQVAAQSETLERLSMQIAALEDQRRSLPASAGAATSARSEGTDAARDAGSADAEPALDAADADTEALIEQLLAGVIEGDEAWELMFSLVGSERLDTLVAELAARAEARPDDPQAQFMVGMGYIAQLQGGANVMQMGQLATQADAAFDRTLALDEDHLDARRTKAISLSFFPPIAGKRPEAIAQFETVIEKQKQHPVQDGFAETYALLGNLHVEGGNTEKAIAVLQDGLAAHPQNAELKAQLEALTGSGSNGQ